MTTAIRKKAIQDGGIIHLSAQDQKILFTALESKKTSVKRFAKLRSAIHHSRKMTGAE